MNGRNVAIIGRHKLVSHSMLLVVWTIDKNARISFDITAALDSLRIILPKRIPKYIVL